MGFLWWGSSDKEQAGEKDKAQVEWTYLPLDAPRQSPPGAADQEYYVTIDLGSMRVPTSNRAYAKYYGAVHSFISAPTFDASANAQFRVVTTPTNLKNIDAANLNRVVQINKRLLGPLPYRGGRLTLEIGLYSVKSADMLDPYLGLLQEMSGVAGVAFVTTAMPFVGLLKKGLDLVTGNAKESTLEIGLSTEMENPEAKWYLMMAGPKHEIQAAGLKVNPQDSTLLDKAGKGFEKYSYMLFKVETSLQRSDWFQIPDLVEPHNKIREALREKDLVRASNFFEKFCANARTSPDLLSADAERICDSLQKRYKLTTAQGVPKSASAPALDIGELKELKIYG